jgi:hypothetical protein
MSPEHQEKVRKATAISHTIVRHVTEQSRAKPRHMPRSSEQPEAILILPHRGSPTRSRGQHSQQEMVLKPTQKVKLQKTDGVLPNASCKNARNNVSIVQVKLATSEGGDGGNEPVFVIERRHASHQLEDENAQRPPIRSTVVALLQNDLWRKVLWSSAESVSLATWRKLLGKAEVGDFQIAVCVDQQVFGLQVPMGAQRYLGSFR